MLAMIDWLSVSQNHVEPHEPFGADLVLHTDPETGEVTREHIVGFQHQGSFDTSLRIRSDGHRVEVSGNPSRFNREDNLFGFTAMADCMQLYNELLASLGLPLFTKGTADDVWDNAKTGHAQILEGCHFSRVDLAWNYETGSDRNADLALRALSACSRRGKAPKVEPSGMVHWGSADYARAKYYNKGRELKAHGNKKAVKTLYRDNIREYCQHHGIVRFEVGLGRKLLHEKKMNGWVLWNDETASELARKYDRANDMQASTTSYQEIAAELEKYDLPRTRALRAQHAAMAWLAGEDLRQSMSKSAFYRVAADLSMVGLDVKIPCNIQSLAVQVRTVDLRPSQAPAWYQHPRGLALAA